MKSVSMRIPMEQMDDLDMGAYKEAGDLILECPHASMLVRIALCLEYRPPFWRRLRLTLAFWRSFS